MVFSANSRNSAGTSSFGSTMPSSSGLNEALPRLQNDVFALFAPGGFGTTDLFRGIQRSSSELYPDLRHGLPLAPRRSHRPDDVVGRLKVLQGVRAALPDVRHFRELWKLSSKRLGSLLAGSDLHFDQGHRLQCP